MPTLAKTMNSRNYCEAMALMNPKEFDEVAELENIIQDNRDKFFHVIDSIPNLKDFKRHAKSQLFKPDEMYPGL